MASPSGRLFLDTNRGQLLFIQSYYEGKIRRRDRAISIFRREERELEEIDQLTESLVEAERTIRNLKL
jgi:hypothetical protein